MRWQVAAVVCATVLASASGARADRHEVASFKSDPEGGRVYLDGAYVGTTPLDLTFHCSQIGDRRYRIERPGCAPVEGILNARVAPGRIVGAAFSFAINLAFQCPTYFVPVKEHLECGANAAAVPADLPDEAPVPVDQLPPRVDLRYAPAPLPPQMKSSGQLHAQLDALQDMRDRGVITEEQFTQERERLLKASGKWPTPAAGQ
ncbi:MAG: SHOCT domain-containing protein [Deltaproteobacteria bacterium]|nr:SHOCT domain-containing protein [Deltaproteobacteria bacterium]